MSIKRVYNFNAGPATLPLEVLSEVERKFMEFGGMSILEISHRSKEFGKIIDGAKSLIFELMELKSDYEVLLMQGGAAFQFAMLPMNFLKGKASYAITGHWSKRALAEAKTVGDVHIAYSSEEEGFSRVPTPMEFKLDPNSDYAHITSNNTIFGAQYEEYPNTGEVPLVADMSSDILSRKIDYNQFSMIYAGAQKNLGPAGVTAVIIKKDLLPNCNENLPSIIKYSVHAEKKSLFNTPSVFSIFVLGEVLKWIKKSGGIEKIEKNNLEKAKLIYNAIDGSSLYKNNVDKKCRSIMNVPFILEDESLTERFVSEAAEKGFVGLKGHRLVGGIRASIYNAFPLEGVQRFVEFMKEYEKKI